MSIGEFLNRIRRGERVDFAETQSLIHRHYRYTPVKFSNGVGQDVLENPAGVNEGSCRIFAFALFHGLDKAETLGLFGDHYRIDVLQYPDKDNHRNIRNFMKYGWVGIRFDGIALTPLKPE